MITKIIHYCWFGNSELPDEIIENINNWKTKLVDYKFMLWNENSINIRLLPKYVTQAYESGKMAFVSDYVRLMALYNHGGIYLDTDVWVLKSFDELLDNECFIGWESYGYISTATIGAKKSNKFIGELLSMYSDLEFIKNGTEDLTPNSKRIFLFLYEKYGNIDAKRISLFPDLTIYTRHFFSPKNYYTGKIKVTNDTFCIHTFSGMWKKRTIKGKMISVFVKIFGEKLYCKLKKILHRERN